MAGFADAVIVGSAIARVVEECEPDGDLIGEVEGFAGALAEAVRGARAAGVEEGR